MSIPIGQAVATTAPVDPGTRQAPRARTRPEERTEAANDTRVSQAPVATDARDGGAVEPEARDRVRAELERDAQVTLGDRRVEFSFDEQTDRVVVRIRDADSDEVVRQLPPDDYLKFIAKFREQLGVLFDEQA